MTDHILSSPAFAGDRPPLWAAFDPGWYRTRYGERLREEAEIESDNGETTLDLSDAALEQHWKQRGVRQGFSPNRFFDEEWYLRQNPDVREGIELGIFDSGFLHYCESGFRSRSPHWLFSEEGYFSYNPDLSPHVLISQGFCNGYDHYLAVGDQEHRKSYLFFDPAVFRAASLAQRSSYDFSIGDFVQFISSTEGGQRRSSWYFNPDWYLQRYPEVADAIRQKIYLNPLHHYLTNGDPTAYDPNPWFSEAFYTSHNPDVAATTQAGAIRNAYEHFVRFGIAEKRQPQEGVDLHALAARPGVQRLMRQKKLPDLFALWVSLQGELPEEPNEAQASNDQYRSLDLQYADTLIPSMMRAPLDFRPVRHPDVSVIIPAANQFRDVLASLAALSNNDPGTLQIILVDAGSTDETQDITRFARGIRVLQPSYRTSIFEQVMLGMGAADADIVLFMAPGTQPFPGAIRAALQNFQEKSIWAVGGQTLGLNGRILEAGTVVWRNGTFCRFGYGRRANESEIAFRRPVDGFTAGMLLCRRERLVALDGIDRNCTGSESRLLSICLTLRQEGGGILYDPSVLAKAPEPPPVPEKLLARNCTIMRHRFAGLLSRQPFPGSNLMRARISAAVPTILFLCSSLPRHSLGTPGLRQRAVMIALSQMGYQVTVFPLDGAGGEMVANALDFPPELELMDDCDQSELPSFLEERAETFDFVWVAGTEVLKRSSTILQQHAMTLPRLGIIADVHGGKAQEDHLRRLVGVSNDREKLLRELLGELEDAWLAQTLVTGYARESEDFNQIGYGNVRELGCAPAPVVFSPGYHERSGILFALPILRSGDAVHDGLHWFIHDVLNHLDKLLPPGATVLLGGYRDRDVDLSAYSRYPRMEALPDDVDLPALYQSRRILIEPSRVLASLPQELVEAAAAGLPAVVGEAARDILSWEDGKNCLSGGFCDPPRFARAVAELYLNEERWNQISSGARQWVEEQDRSDRFGRQLKDILDLAVGNGPLPVSSVPVHMLQERPEDQLFAPAPLRLHWTEQDTGAPVDSSGHDDTLEDTSSDDHSQTLAPRLGVSLPHSGK
ncbi:glycosyltransferase [Gluconobacter morbifer]|uniref:Putative glycosyl transferase n=1 Tax=Gluconobacter morbifer G707 TaxID=1088869 RepID=G6XIU2_9PROT|nr:glycosyltransferase [Gluconobacter morbifer]EHH68268.1 putative glycosyl transferase [Gluconobacter morbifer G707]